MVVKMTESWGISRYEGTAENLVRTSFVREENMEEEGPDDTGPGKELGCPGSLD